MAVSASAAARCAMKGITGVPVTINSITVQTVENKNTMYGMAVNARSVERQRTHSAMTASASTVGRERSLGVMRESARNYVWSIAVAAAKKDTPSGGDMRHPNDRIMER